MVSVTIYFNRETESDQIEQALAINAPLIKSVSMLPHTEEGVYPQSPYQKITHEEYLERNALIKEIDWSSYCGSDGIMPRFCTNDTCIL
jgi:ribonucleoside-diphosphate reductase alpha chain